MDITKLTTAQRLLNSGMPPKDVAASLGVSEATLHRALADSVLLEANLILDGVSETANERIAITESSESPAATGEGDSDGVAWNAFLGQGEAVRRAWVRTGLLVPASELATSWGCSEQALDQATEDGELFDLQAGDVRYYPAAFTRLEMEAVKAVCSQLKGDDVVAKFVFWNKTHGALGGLGPVDAIRGAGQSEKVIGLAAAWSDERGLTA